MRKFHLDQPCPKCGVKSPLFYVRHRYADEIEGDILVGLVSCGVCGHEELARTPARFHEKEGEK
jgi:hypothetical protein